MRPDDDAARTTHDGKNPLRTRGRREEDQLLAGWSWGKVGRIAGAMLAVVTLVGGAFNYTIAKIATRQEVTQATERIAESVDAVSGRVTSLEIRATRADSATAIDRQVNRAVARLLCLTSEQRDAMLAELPCSSLGITPQIRRMR